MNDSDVNPPNSETPSIAAAQPPPLPVIPFSYYAPTPLLAPLPRVWTAIVTPIVATVVALGLASVAITVPAIAQLGLQGVQDRDRLLEWLGKFGSTPSGFMLLVLPGQVVFLAAALLAAWLSPEPIVRRLGLNRPSTPWLAMPLLLLATPFAGFCGDLLMTSIFGDGRSEHLEMLYNLFRAPAGAFLVLVVFCVAFMPGFGEEMLFRGYTQSRLLKRWPPALAIGLTSLMFAVAHADFQHIFGVLPIGIWLGVVAWLSGSIWPGIICHTANNALAVLATNLLGGTADPTEHLRLDAQGLTTLGVTGMFVVLSVWVMCKYRKREQPEGFPVTPRREAEQFSPG